MSHSISKQPVKEFCQTFEREDVKGATAQLIQDNAETLIKFIYNNKDKCPYNSPHVRVGLTLKTLLKINTHNRPIDGDVLEEAIEELKALRDSSKDAIQHGIYDDELRYLQCCIIHSDMVTLNTIT
jgi:hypothetical protein